MGGAQVLWVPWAIHRYLSNTMDGTNRFWDAGDGSWAICICSVLRQFIKVPAQHTIARIFHGTLWAFRLIRNLASLSGICLRARSRSRKVYSYYLFLLQRISSSSPSKSRRRCFGLWHYTLQLQSQSSFSTGQVVTLSLLNLNGYNIFRFSEDIGYCYTVAQQLCLVSVHWDWVWQEKWNLKSADCNCSCN